MLKSPNEVKDKINMLLNPDNFYGKHTGGLGRVLLFCVAVCIPFMLYTLFLTMFIPFKLFMVVFIPYTIYMALEIIGRQKERKAAYLRQKNDQYASAKELIRILDIHEDGLVEYVNGNICYIISAFTYSYLSDHNFARDLNNFIYKIASKYNVDVYGHLVTQELVTTQEDLEHLNVYEDSEFLQERLNFYKYQDEYTNNNSMLYRLNFVVKSYKNNWGKLNKFVLDLLKSENVRCFRNIKLCSKEEANKVISRDLCLFVDLGEMLMNKHNSNDYFGSKVLYFGDKKETEEEQKDILEERRVTDVK